MTEATTEEPQAKSNAASSDGSNSRRSSMKSMKSGMSTSRRGSFARRGSALFASARASFVRSRGQSGASVEKLRGTSGSNYEGYANIHRGEGFHCFVFENEGSKSPKYAIELINRKAVIQPSHDTIIPHVAHPGAGDDTGYTTVHLETSLGDVEYKFTFANLENTASEFCNAVAVASSDASTEMVRKRLGHENLLTKRSSMKFANAVGAAKAKDQPDAPVTAAEVVAGMPNAGTY